MDCPASHAGGQERNAIQDFLTGKMIFSGNLCSPMIEYLQHHDLAVLPNGNLLTVAWEFKTDRGGPCCADGHRPDLLVGGGPTGRKRWSWSLNVVGSDDAEIVWEWHALGSFLFRTSIPRQENYGTLSEHPELSDINSDAEEFDACGPRRRSLHDLLTQRGGRISVLDRRGGFPEAPDILHINGIAYNPDLDQFVVSIHDISARYLGH